MLERNHSSKTDGEPKILGALHFGSGAVHSGLNALHFGLGAPHFGLGALHFGLGAPHSGLSALHSGPSDGFSILFRKGVDELGLGFWESRQYVGRHPRRSYRRSRPPIGPLFGLSEK